ncbi:MAG: hypothetical protein BGO04_04500 [Microbacterium sp. 70-38]|nr:MAG: hypothetical protein BGO04_04500 [Microbacterium sp. 70-38]
MQPGHAEVEHLGGRQQPDDIRAASRSPARAIPCVTIAESCAHTAPRWQPRGREPPASVDVVRTPKPELIDGPVVR